MASLEREMRMQDRWEIESPSIEALSSVQPFAFDTLEFDQWLQWIFLARLQTLLVQQLPLPTECAVQAMAEEVYGSDDEGARRLVGIIGEIDRLLRIEGHNLH